MKGMNFGGRIIIVAIVALLGAAIVIVGSARGLEGAQDAAEGCSYMASIVSDMTGGGLELC